MKDQVGNVVDATVKGRPAKFWIETKNDKIVLTSWERGIATESPKHSYELTRGNAIALAHILLTLTQA